MAWHYVRDNATQGPVDLAELKRLRHQGIIQSETPVWTDGMTDWTTYGKIPVTTGPTVTTVNGVTVTTRPCIECGKTFPEEDMLQYEGNWVCAACKPLFFQRLREGIALPGNLPYASVGRRFVAVFIDGIFLYVLGLIPSFVVNSIDAWSSSKHPEMAVTIAILLGLFNLVMGASYEIFLVGKYGATLGKMAMKVKVVRPDGSSISYGQSTGRYFGKMLSSFTMMIGYLMAFWDPERRALHDRLCTTRVISTETV